MSIAALCIITPNWKQPKYPSTGDWKTVIGTSILLSNKNERTTDSCNNVVQSQIHYATHQWFSRVWGLTETEKYERNYGRVMKILHILIKVVVVGTELFAEDVEFCCMQIIS